MSKHCAPEGLKALEIKHCLLPLYIMLLLSNWQMLVGLLCSLTLHSPITHLRQHPMWLLVPQKVVYTSTDSTQKVLYEWGIHIFGGIPAFLSLCVSLYFSSLSCFPRKLWYQWPPHLWKWIFHRREVFLSSNFAAATLANPWRLSQCVNCFLCNRKLNLVAHCSLPPPRLWPCTGILHHAHTRPLLLSTCVINLQQRKLRIPLF